MNIIQMLASTVSSPSTMEIIKQVLMLFGGLGVFLFGMKAMGDNLETVAGSKMRGIFDKISGNRITGMLTGAGLTAVIQSSSATTVMVVGFVNAGIMTLMQAAPIIMGANIGTTITAQIVALQFLPITQFVAAIGAVGAFLMMSKKDVLKKVGAILAGLGLIFIGLYLMSDSMKFMRQLPIVVEMLSKASNPFLLMFIGLVFTALIQSSSATTGILITMAAEGLLGLEQVMFATLGINIGTCITAVLAAIGTTTNAKRASIIHLLFNVIGAILFFPIVMWSGIEKGLVVMFPEAITMQIAMFHTFFNLATTLVLLPFTKLLVKAATLIIREKKTSKDEQIDFVANKFKFIDSRLLSTPTIAINQTKKEILLMSDLAKSNLIDSIESITKNKPLNVENFKQRETHINFLNREISKFLVHLSAEELSFKDELMLASYYHVVSDLERVGDYSENIMEYSQELNKLKTNFSEFAVGGVNDMYEKVLGTFENSIKAFELKDTDYISVVNEYENQVDKCKTDLDIEHIKRLNNNICSPDAGALFLSLVNDLERISDHMQNVALSIQDYTAKPKKIYATIK